MQNTERSRGCPERDDIRPGSGVRCSLQNSVVVRTAMARKKSPSGEQPVPSINFDAARKAHSLVNNVAKLAEFAALVLVNAGELRIKNKRLGPLTLTADHRKILLDLPDLPESIRKKLAAGTSSFTIAEAASMTMIVAEACVDNDPRKQVSLLLIGHHLSERLMARIDELAKPKQTTRTKADSTTIFQFKITLIGSKPPIWRRIQVEDCTLDKLHEHIQTAMGLTNSHLHQFEIFEKRYGDPELLDDGFDDFKCVDSTKTRISQITPNAGKRFSFTYEYDFGDGWEHQIRFEGSPKKEQGQKYPVCLEGERACPPEDIGGVGGFYDFLDALADPDHEQHDEFIEWGGNFDADKFDTKQATKAMRSGLPHWRDG